MLSGFSIELGDDGTSTLGISVAGFGVMTVGFCATSTDLEGVGVLVLRSFASSGPHEDKQINTMA